MARRKKLPPRIVPGLERTPDNREFFIPQISKLNEKKKTRKEFVSSVSGSANKNDVHIPMDRKGTGDIDKKYDAFRKKRKLTKEEAKKRYGHQYYEFVRVDGDSIKKAHSPQGLTNEDLLAKDKLKAEEKAKLEANVRTVESVSVDEFFDSAKKHTEKEEDIFESEVLKDLITDEENQTEEAHVYVEEEKENEEIIYQEPEEKLISEEIEFTDDFEYTEYKPPVNPVKTEPVPSADHAQNFSNYRLPPIELFKKSVKKESGITSHMV